jgi:hypothetical protein
MMQPLQLQRLSKSETAALRPSSFPIRSTREDRRHYFSDHRCVHVAVKCVCDLVGVSSEPDFSRRRISRSDSSTT